MYKFSTLLVLLLGISISHSYSFNKIISSKLSKNLAVSLIALNPFLFNVNHVEATESKLIGDIPTAGFIFRDSLKVFAFKDPKIPQISIYLSDFDRPITEKLAKNFFDDPSSTSLACVQTAPINTDDIKISANKEGEEVFEESRNLFFKKIRVDRLYDKDTNSIVYTAYSTRLNTNDDPNKSRYKSSLCAVHLN